MYDSVDVFFIVVDDTDHDRITAGSLVTLSVSLKRTDLINHCEVSVQELVADDPSDLLKETPPLQDGEIDDEVCRSQEHCAISAFLLKIQHIDDDNNML